ncbi:PREDICTED: vesicle-associated protein 3-1-like [Tarenaya hassleriana]|uniref:vesicle-associated protein 3-1-like n=1 Tax=Tarenaya hassleriana TaxID=28532 RepID=UPI00053C6F8A|nr:PREDICTED: vesicle-associated protein 3-1-like [Tarenaya hassleriana]
MSTGELLDVEPLELKFPFELKKRISCSVRLSNKTDSYVAFKVKTTNPKKYCVRPNMGIVMPESTCDIIVTMQAQKEAPPDMQCMDKFLLQSVKAPKGSTPNSEMFNKKGGNVVEECKLPVVYVLPPPHRPSPVSSYPEASASEISIAVETCERLALEDVSIPMEARASIYRLREEKKKAILESNRLRKELELQRPGHLSWMHVLLVGLFGFFMGSLLNMCS